MRGGRGPGGSVALPRLRGFVGSGARRGSGPLERSRAASRVCGAACRRGGPRGTFSNRLGSSGGSSARRLRGLAVPRAPGLVAFGRRRRLSARRRHAALRERGAHRVRRPRRRAIVDQARGPESHWLLQGPGHDRGDIAGALPRRPRGGLRVDRQHLGVARRVRRAGGTRLGGSRSRGEDLGRQAGSDARLRRAADRSRRYLRRLPAASRRGSRFARSLRRQLGQPVPARRTEDDRLRIARST